jgi:hypothetical protein
VCWLWCVGVGAGYASSESECVSGGDSSEADDLPQARTYSLIHAVPCVILDVHAQEDGIGW